MPASVSSAAPATVLPRSLALGFIRQQEYPVIESVYGNGESQRSVQATTSRRRWRLAKRLAPSQLAELRAFYEARNGPVEPFYFYDPYETSPRFTHDQTGQSTFGRYIVRFDCEWNQNTGPARSDVQIDLIELA
jgi:phage-related protein